MGTTGSDDRGPTGAEREVVPSRDITNEWAISDMIVKTARWRPAIHFRIMDQNAAKRSISSRHLYLTAS